jgi:DNA-binding NarL/FixJ family response regulator
MDEALPVTTGHADPVQVLRVVVVDDHRMFTEALAATLSDEPDLRVVGTFASTEPGLAAAVAGLRPDLVTVDVEPFDGPVARLLVERLTEPMNGPGVVVLTAADEPARVAAAARAGALGWLSKEAPTGELLATLRAVAAGHACFPATYLGVVLRELVGELRRGGDRAGPLAVLSPQERRILAGMVAGERAADRSPAPPVGGHGAHPHPEHLRQAGRAQQAGGGRRCPPGGRGPGGCGG